MYSPILEVNQSRHILLQMDLSSECNLQCIHCYRYSHPPRIEPVRAEHVHIFKTQIFPFVHRANLSTIGEPLTSRYLLEVVDAAKKAGVACVGMTTNGTLLTGDVSWGLLERGLDWLAVSVDAIKRETYESIRRGGNWDTLLANLVQLNRLREQYPGRMSLALNFSLMNQNVDEAVGFLSFARKVGADSVNYLPLMIEREEMKSWSLFYTPSRWNHLMRLLRQEAARIGIPAVIPVDLPREIIPITQVSNKIPVSIKGLWDWFNPTASYSGPCNAARGSWIFLTSDGNCYPCLNVLEKGLLGNVFQTPFTELWNSPLNQKFRRQANEVGQVQGCDHCKLFALREVPAEEAAYLSRDLSLSVSSTRPGGITLPQKPRAPEVNSGAR